MQCGRCNRVTTSQATMYSESCDLNIECPYHPLPLLLTGAIVYAFDTEEEMLLSFRHFVQDCPSICSICTF